MPAEMTKHIAIIGAGPSGLVTAKTMLQAGFQVTVFEAGSEIGGTWVYENDSGRSFIYRNLHINTAKELTRFGDFPFADGVSDFPSHWDMHRYLRDYARHFGVAGHVRFRSTVTAVRPLFKIGEPPRWQVETEAGDAGTFDAVAVCTSPFIRPHHAKELRDAFQGRYLHAAEYREPGAFAGKRVCIAGAGNSAVDIASDICTTASRTVLVARSGVFITPQYIFGKSFNELVVKYLQRWWVPDWLRRRVVRGLVFAVHGDVTKLGFKAPSHRVHATTSATIVADIAFGRVAVRQGIDGIDGGTIRFTGGTAEEFDVLIAATGYDTEFPFIPRDILAAFGNELPLYKRVVTPDWPGLYFVGMINLDSPINYASERQAWWIRELELGRTILPTIQEMNADIAAKRKWVKRFYGDAQRHVLQEESKPYYAALRREIRRGARRPPR